MFITEVFSLSMSPEGLDWIFCLRKIKMGKVPSLARPSDDDRRPSSHIALR
jgi:hypothetical protein